MFFGGLGDLLESVCLSSFLWYLPRVVVYLFMAFRCAYYMSFSDNSHDGCLLLRFFLLYLYDDVGMMCCANVVFAF